MELFRPKFSWKDWENHKTSQSLFPAQTRTCTYWIHSESLPLDHLPRSTSSGPSKSWYHVDWQGYPSVSKFNEAEDGCSVLLRNVDTHWLLSWEWKHIFPLTDDTYPPDCTVSLPRRQHIGYPHHGKNIKFQYAVLLLPDVGAYIYLHRSHQPHAQIVTVSQTSHFWHSTTLTQYKAAQNAARGPQAVLKESTSRPRLPKVFQ